MIEGILVLFLTSEGKLYVLSSFLTKTTVIVGGEEAKNQAEYMICLMSPSLVREFMESGLEK